MTTPSKRRIINDMNFLKNNKLPGVYVQIDTRNIMHASAFILGYTKKLWIDHQEQYMKTVFSH